MPNTQVRIFLNEGSCLKASAACRYTLLRRYRWTRYADTPTCTATTSQLREASSTSVSAACPTYSGSTKRLIWSAQSKGLVLSFSRSDSAMSCGVQRGQGWGQKGFGG